MSDDAHLSSQINNRKEQTISAGWELRTQEGNIDLKATESLQRLDFLQDLFGHILDSEYFGYSLVELFADDNKAKCRLIPRRNVVPDFGRFYKDTSLDNYIEYRNDAEYGRYLLEFNADHLGILNKAVPHALFKRFAESCWSELCEIYGIPPRVIKTDTRDPEMLNRAEDMMRDIGAAAWFIIDTTEAFEFANAVNTNGEVYNNLITHCKNEISMLISGAIVGQDTKNGNESKEKVSMQITDRLVEADRRMIENYMNSVVIAALCRIGWLAPTSSVFSFSVAEDLSRLFEMTVQLLPHKKVSDQFIIDKFGIQVEGDRFETPQLPTDPKEPNNKEDKKLNF